MSTLIGKVDAIPGYNIIGYFPDGGRLRSNSEGFEFVFKSTRRLQGMRSRPCVLSVTALRAGPAPLTLGALGGKLYVEES